MRVLLLALSVVLGVGAIAAACGSDSDTGVTGDCPGKHCCEPGAFIFCKCSNGDDGSKECNANGESFKTCMAQAGGECPDRGDSSSSDPTSTSGDPGPSSTSGDPGGPGGGGVGGGGPGNGEFLAPCAKNEDCQSGNCPMGYCTKDCAAVSECPSGVSECVNFGGNQICLATCGFVGDQSNPEPGVNPSPDDCGVFGDPSACGYAKAVDGWPVLTCADWGPFLALPPDGTDCNVTKWDNTQCNLGHVSPGVEQVCTFGACANGCYGDEDCPSGKNCSGGGNLGNCN